MSPVEPAVLAMTPKRRMEMWKNDPSDPAMPIVILGDGKWIRLNVVGAIIWELCTAENTVSRIVDTVATRFPDVGREVIEADTIAFLEEFDRRRIIVLDYDPLAP